MRAICRSTRRRDRLPSRRRRALRGASRQRAAAHRGSLNAGRRPTARARGSALALARGALARGGELGDDLGVEDLLARLIELVHRAGLAEALGELRGGLGRRPRAWVRKPTSLARRDRPVIGAPRLVATPQRLQRGAQLRLMETLSARSPSAPAASRAPGCRRRCGARSRAAPTPAMRISENVGLGGRLAPPCAASASAELVVGRLQAAVVEQRDLHGGIRRERAAEQPVERGARRRRVLVAADRDDRLSSAGPATPATTSMPPSGEKVWQADTSSVQANPTREWAGPAVASPWRAAPGIAQAWIVPGCRWNSDAGGPGPPAQRHSGSGTMGGRLMRSGPRPVSFSNETGRIDA